MPIFKSNTVNRGNVLGPESIRSGLRFLSGIHFHYLTVEIGIPEAIPHLAWAQFSGTIASYGKKEGH